MAAASEYWNVAPSGAPRCSRAAARCGDSGKPAPAKLAAATTDSGERPKYRYPSLIVHDSETGPMFGSGLANFSESTLSPATSELSTDAEKPASRMRGFWL